MRSMGTPFLSEERPLGTERKKSLTTIRHRSSQESHHRSGRVIDPVVGDANILKRNDNNITAEGPTRRMTGDLC